MILLKKYPKIIEFYIKKSKVIQKQFFKHINL